MSYQIRIGLSGENFDNSTLECLFFFLFSSLIIMQKLFEQCRQIYSDKYLKEGETMVATSSVLQKLRENLRVVEVRESKVSHKFIVNGRHALFARSVTYSTRKARRDVYDREKICTEVGNAIRAIKRFFKQEQGKRFVLGLNLGNERHDMAVFVRKDDHIYDLVHFDPNGGASSQTMDRFSRGLPRSARRRGYHPKNGNPDGKCSYLSWMELLEFILLNKNPFLTENLLEFDTLNRIYMTKSELDNLMARRREERRRHFKRGSQLSSNKICRRLE